MLVTISSWSYRNLFTLGAMNYDSYLAEVKRVGADGIEIFPGYLDPQGPMGHVQAIADKAETMGLSVSTLIVRNNFAMPSAQERERQVSHVRTCVVTAAASGIQRLNVFTGEHTDGQDAHEEQRRVVECFRECVPLAEENCITLCLENCSTVGPDADSILAIVAAVDNPVLRTNPDPTNLFHSCGLTGERIYEETRKLMPLAGSFHLRVGADSFCGADRSGLDLARTVAMLREFGYDGHIVLEHDGGTDPIGDCERAVATVRRYLAHDR